MKFKKGHLIGALLILTGVSLVTYDEWVEQRAYNKTQKIAESTATQLATPVIKDIEDTENYKIDDLVIEVLTEDQKVEQVKNMKNVLEVPKADIKAYIYDNVSDDSLTYGVGRYPDTAQIGENGNTVIAGHSSTVYNSVLNGVENLELFDTFYIYNESGKKLTYYVTNMYVVEPEDIWVLDAKQLTYNEVNLLTCTNGGKQRLIIEGRGYTPAQLANYKATQYESKLQELQEISNNIRLDDLCNYFIGLGSIEPEVYLIDHLQVGHTKTTVAQGVSGNNLAKYMRKDHSYNPYFNTKVSVFAREE